jgi:hypothetical protein
MPGLRDLEKPCHEFESLINENYISGIHGIMDGYHDGSVAVASVM